MRYQNSQRRGFHHRFHFNWNNPDGSIAVNGQSKERISFFLEKVEGSIPPPSSPSLSDSARLQAQEVRQNGQQTQRSPMKVTAIFIGDGAIGGDRPSYCNGRFDPW
jgi:hypothetical protein